MEIKLNKFITLVVDDNLNAIDDLDKNECDNRKAWIVADWITYEKKHIKMIVGRNNK